MASRRLQPRPLGEALRADVAVADGMALPYRPACCDGALCIAVLHHISTPARRTALLDQLLRILRPGGRALVTVWATEQENMRKVRSWRPVAEEAGSAAAPEALAGPADEPVLQQPRQEQQEQQEGEAVASGDYFVPWHLPFHRTEAAAAARQAGSTAPAAAAPQLDAAKGAVVFQRFYHLFERGELDALVAGLPEARLLDSFYDKDNWCCVFERVAVVASSATVQPQNPGGGGGGGGQGGLAAGR